MIKIINRRFVEDALAHSDLSPEDCNTVANLIDRFGTEIAGIVQEHIDASPPGSGFYTGMLIGQVLTAMGQKTRKLSLEALIDVLGGSNAQG